MCSSKDLEDEEDAYSLNLLSKLENLQILGTLAQKRLKKLGATYQRNLESMNLNKNNMHV